MTLSLLGAADDMRSLSVALDGVALWPPGSLALLSDGRWWEGGELSPIGAATHEMGDDYLGSFERRARSYQIGKTAAIVELAARMYGDALVFEQSFPLGLNASGNASSAITSGAGQTVGLAPLASWPSFNMCGAASKLGWRSWHGSWGSYTGIGLSSADSLIFNGVPTMPLHFFSSGASDAAVVVSPLAGFKDAAHAAVDEDSGGCGGSARVSWRHGTSSRYSALPAAYSHETVLLAARGPTAAMRAWGDAMLAWHRTDRSAARAADVSMRMLGLWTDNGAYYNFNKWAGNRMPGWEWSPRETPSTAPAALLASAVETLRAAGVRPGYVQLDDWWCDRRLQPLGYTALASRHALAPPWHRPSLPFHHPCTAHRPALHRYDGVVFDGAVSCVRAWRERRDWFPDGLAAFGEAAGVGLLLCAHPRPRALRHPQKASR